MHLVLMSIDLCRLEINQYLSQLGRHPTAESVSTLAKQQDWLINSLGKFNVDSRKYLGLEAYNECIGEDESEGGGEVATKALNTEFEPYWDPVDLPDICKCNPHLTRNICDCNAVGSPCKLGSLSATSPTLKYGNGTS